MCHWNLNTIAAHYFSKSFLLEAYSVHLICNIICLSETYLDSFAHYDDPILNLSDYELVRPDNLSNNERGSVGIYFKETLAIRRIPINSLKECLLLEVFIGNKTEFALFRSSSQSQEEFYDFLFSLHQLLSNMINQNLIFLVTFFNARNSSR